MGKEMIDAPRTVLSKTKKIFKDRIFQVIDMDHERNVESVEQILRDSECPVCLEVVVFPYRTTCGHLFCHNCILFSLKERPQCPLCRHEISLREVSTPDLDILTVIDHYVNSKFSRPEQELYKRRVEQYINIANRRFYPSSKLFIGLRVDVWMRNDWVQGEITQILPTKTQNFVEVRSTREGKVEIFNTFSRDIARFCYFTQGNDENEKRIRIERNQDFEFANRIRLIHKISLSKQVKEELIRAIQEKHQSVKLRRARVNGQMF